MEQKQILARIVNGARETLQADAAALRLLSAEGAHLCVAAVSGLPDEDREQKSLPVERCPLDKEALTGQPVIVADSASDPRAAGVAGDLCSLVCVPLMHEGESVGTLRVYAAEPGCFGEEEVNRLMPLADLGAAVITALRDLEALEDLRESRDRFIRVATHELRSPVTVAQSLVRGVLKGYAGELTEEQQDAFARVSRRLDYLESLVNDLLDLAAGRAPELTGEEGPVTLNDSVGRAVLLIQPQAEEKGVELTHQASPDELVVRGTEEGLDRIFVNLVENAVKYTPPGGSVTVSTRRMGDEVQVEVSDDGIGIPEEAKPHLFDEFYRAPNAKEVEEVGTGLGLTIVKDLVEQYDGHIEVESTVGEGSMFAVTFPMLVDW